MLDGSEPRRARFLGRAVALLAAATVASLATPAMSLAADPPTIVTAGIDARDQLYATWTLAPGTTFKHVEFATAPTPDPDLPAYFDDGHFADFECADCDSSPTATSYTGVYPIKRDRRYFVKVAANSGQDAVTSAVWVIDDAKPVIPGNAPVGREPTNMPVLGKPWDGLSLLPAGAVSSASAKLLKPPKTVHGLLVAGVRVRVTCSVACGFEAKLTFDGGVLAEADKGYAAGGSRTLTFKPSGTFRARLRRHPRTKLRIAGRVAPLEGAARTLARTFSVKR